MMAMTWLSSHMDRVLGEIIAVFSAIFNMIYKTSGSVHIIVDFMKMLGI